MGVIVAMASEMACCSASTVRAFSERSFCFTFPQHCSMGWKSGEFAFERSDDPVIRHIKESTEALILEGMKRFDEWERVEEDLPDMHVVLRQRAYAVNEKYEGLSPEGQTVLRLVDAQRDVSTIIRESGLEPMGAVRAITELLSEGLVEQWSGTRSSGDVLMVRGRLPESSGEIDVTSRSYFSSKERLEKERVGVSAREGDEGESDR